METDNMDRRQLVEYVETLKEQLRKEGKELPQKTNLPAFDSSTGLLFNNLPVGLIITDIKGRILNFNKTIEDLFGYSIEEYRNTNVADLYADPEARAGFTDAIARSKAMHGFEMTIKHRDGSLRNILASTDYIEEGEDEGLLLTSLSDITQFKEIERELEDSAQSYQSLFSNAPVGIIVTDMQGDLIVGNHAMEELMGYSAEELKDSNAAEFYDDAGEREILLSLTKKIGVVRDFKTSFRHKSGRIISVLINTDIIDYKDFKNVLLTSVRDITNLKKAEEQLTEERDFSNAIFDMTASLIIVMDHEGKIIRFNRTCEVITGFSFDEVRGRNLAEMPFAGETAVREHLRRPFHDRPDDPYETIWHPKQGEERTIRWIDSVLPDISTGEDLIILTGSDITELKRSNAELSSNIEELEMRTREMDLLNQMGEQLQSCMSIEEACSVSDKYIQVICPSSSGALYLINEKENSAEAVRTWGKPLYSKESFPAMDCWAIRKGRQHIADLNHPGLICSHITGPENGQYLCIPLTVSEKVLGILHMNHVETSFSPKDQRELYNEHNIQVVKNISEHIGLALYNLSLRETLKEQSIRDPLTDLFNRRYMEETIEREMKKAIRESRSVGVIMIDIDHFKGFNDTEGHDAGDAVLRELGRFLSSSVRGGDFVCRYGGEEFLAVLPGICTDDLISRAEDMRKGISSLQIRYLDRILPKCTISAGMAVFPDNGETRESLIRAADEALYIAKEQGRDRTVMAGEGGWGWGK